MARSPAGRRPPRADGATAEQWLRVPGWRKPLDALLVLAATSATAWVGLVVIPAAANSNQAAVTQASAHTADDAASLTAGPRQDPRQWIAGPVYTGGTVAPTTVQVIAAGPVDVVQPVINRATPSRTTQAAPRTTAKPTAPRTTASAGLAAATTATTATGAPTTTTTTTTSAPTTTTPTTTTDPSTRTTTPATSSSSDPTTTSPASTSTTPTGP